MAAHKCDTYDDYVRMKMCSSKIRYDNDLDAIAACLSWSQKHHACRFYHCPRCGGYHITSHVGD